MISNKLTPWSDDELIRILIYFKDDTITYNNKRNFIIHTLFLYIDIDSDYDVHD